MGRTGPAHGHALGGLRPLIFNPAVGSPVAAGDAPVSVALGDVNGDGRPDLAVANSTSNNVSVLLGNGDGTFQPPVNFAAGDILDLRRARRRERGRAARPRGGERGQRQS